MTATAHAAPLTVPDARASWGGCLPATPYQRGFEDGRYGRVYANPYPLRSAAWARYEAGSQDARKARREEQGV